MHAAKGIAQYASRAARLGAMTRESDHFLVEALFLTVTNVNFDDERFLKVLRRAVTVRDTARDVYESAARAAGQEPEEVRGPAVWRPAEDLDGFIRQGRQVAILFDADPAGPDISGLKELLTYGIKGAAAYAEHAAILNYESDEIAAFFRDALAALADGGLGMNELLGLCLRCGEVNLKVMGLLDKAHTRTFGHPVPTAVRVEPIKGKAILVSGHDLKDLEALLIQTSGRGVHTSPQWKTISRRFFTREAARIGRFMARQPVAAPRIGFPARRQPPPVPLRVRAASARQRADRKGG